MVGREQVGPHRHCFPELSTFVGIAWLLSLPREPVYGGRRLTSWMNQYQRYLLARPGTVGAGQRDEALNAIREIGTNALPTHLDNALDQEIKAAG